MRVPSTLERLMESRLGAVPEETRETLLAVALLAQPSVHVLAKALEDRVRVERDLDVSEAAGLLVVERDGIRFAHPLFASVLVASATAQSADACIAGLPTPPRAGKSASSILRSPPTLPMQRSLRSSTAQQSPLERVRLRRPPRTWLSRRWH